MTEEELKIRYQADFPVHQACGAWVNGCIVEALTRRLGSEEQTRSFLKIPPEPRIKELKSLVSKAFYRNKNYGNPYADITDKVGVRYVVLLREQIKVITEIVEQNADWTASKDKDFEKEREENPLVFDYQSVHYIVRNRSPLDINGVSLPADTPCEVQIRTLLQHAYSELTHDTVYKPSMRANPSVHRSIAKSMALMEATDDIFCQVNEALQKEGDKMNAFLQRLTALYRTMATPEHEEKVNNLILDAYRDLLDTVSASDVEQYVSDNAFVKDVLSRKAPTSFLYRQPVVLFLFYLVSQQRTNCKRLWPLTDAELRPLYADLGIAFDSGS